MSDSERQLARWRATLDLCSALIIPAAALPGLLAETREAAEEAAGQREAAAVAAAAAVVSREGSRGGNHAPAGGVSQRPSDFDSAPEKAVGDMIRVVQLRSDYHPAILSVAAADVGGGGGTKRGTGATHRRAGSFMGTMGMGM